MKQTSACGEEQLIKRACTSRLKQQNINSDLALQIGSLFSPQHSQERPTLHENPIAPICFVRAFASVTRLIYFKLAGIAQDGMRHLLSVGRHPTESEVLKLENLRQK